MGAWLLASVRLLVVVQAAQATVGGVVRDNESGEPLPGAVVALTDIDRTAISDAQGRYSFTAVPAGPQHVIVRRIGYAARSLHALVPTRGELHINVMLVAVPVRLREVEVRPAVAVRGADHGDHAPSAWRGISSAALRNHPMLAEPDAFLALTGGGVTMRPEAPAGVHLRGGAPDQTGFTLDGIPVFNPYHAGGTVSAWNPDALAGIEVLSPRAAFDALSGVIAGATRAPAAQLRARGALSSSQARVTIDGPLGRAGAGFLLSGRSGFLGFVDPKRERSYLAGETGDVLATIQLPVASGQFRALAWDSENEISAAARASDGPRGESPPVRNEFAWHSRSTGAEWSRRVGAFGVRLAGWQARSDVDATWSPEGSATVQLASEREDLGLLFSADRRAGERVTTAGVGFQRSRTVYDLSAADRAIAPLMLTARNPISTVFIEHERSLGRFLSIDFAASATADSRRLYPASNARLRWQPLARMTLVASYDRSHQFSQSLRNSESVVGSVFPADLYIGAGSSGVPVARSDQGVLAAEYRIRDGVTVGAQLYARNLGGLLLVAPRTGDPFAVRDFTTGSASARGVSLDAAAGAARYGAIASYGWQVVRVSPRGSSYVPTYGTGHLVETGVIFFPSPTSSVQLGATGEAGRRTTPVSQAFEWEACNLIDDGCELGGSPRHDASRLGATRLPSYLRLDLGMRKHWHRRVAGVEAQIGLFGTLTNVLGRKNIFAVAPGTVETASARMEMRPRAPLVVGLDWRF